MSGAMIGVPGEYGPGTIDLLGQNNSDQPVGERELRQRHDFVRSGQTRGIQTIRTTYEKRDVTALHTPMIQLPGQLLCATTHTVTIQSYYPVVLTQLLEQSFRLLGAGSFGLPPLAAARGDLYERQLGFPWQAPGILIEAVGNPGPRPFANR